MSAADGCGYSNALAASLLSEETPNMKSSFLTCCKVKKTRHKSMVRGEMPQLLTAILNSSYFDYLYFGGNRDLKHEEMGLFCKERLGRLLHGSRKRQRREFVASPESLKESLNLRKHPSYLLRQLMSSLVSLSQRFSLGSSIHAFREPELETIHIRICARLVVVIRWIHTRK